MHSWSSWGRWGPARTRASPPPAPPPEALRCSPQSSPTTSNPSRFAVSVSAGRGSIRSNFLAFLDSCTCRLPQSAAEQFADTLHLTYFNITNITQKIFVNHPQLVRRCYVLKPNMNPLPQQYFKRITPPLLWIQDFRKQD